MISMGEEDKKSVGLSLEWDEKYECYKHVMPIAVIRNKKNLVRWRFQR